MDFAVHGILNKWWNQSTSARFLWDGANNSELQAAFENLIATDVLPPLTTK